MNQFTFDPVKLKIDATENLWGRKQHAGEFTVLLEPEEEDKTAKDSKTKVVGALDRMFNVLTAYAALATSAKNEGEGNSKSNVHFGDIDYKAEDIGNQYYYNMHQEEGSLGGVTYDKTNYRIRVTVDATDNEDGTMKIETTFDPGDTFTNKYSSGPGGPSGGPSGGPGRPSNPPAAALYREPDSTGTDNRKATVKSPGMGFPGLLLCINYMN